MPPLPRLARASHSQAAPRALCYVSQSTDPYANLALEDRLLRLTDPQTHVLFLWRNRPTVVIGRNQNPWKECDLGAMRARDVWLARRTSGGGAVYHDLGNTNYTVVMPRADFGRDRCARMVARALRDHADIPATVTARHDVAVGGRKVSGSAFRLTAARAFHHGTMLIDADLARLGSSLRSRNAAAITANGVDSVRSPVANLRDYSWTIDHAAFCAAVCRAFAADIGHPGLDPVSVPAALAVPPCAGANPAAVASAARLASWDWLYGQTPDFVLRLDGHFSWATVSATIAAHRGHIASAAVATAPEACRPPPHVAAAFAAIARALPGARYARAAAAARLDPLRTSPHATELCDWILAALDD
ncbi:hypothetical protein H4R18_003285 [Coemansia javaensis]|uniref:Putative lipoate-protein ligase A n=1 Tax=Coemansia javaensis TaxID=2761396 RepID=A0A9W8LHI7_9FUNG|nr:hypothetical protein H4R18_003285 [Coemansia javaensis]